MPVQIPFGIYVNNIVPCKRGIEVSLRPNVSFERATLKHNYLFGYWLKVRLVYYRASRIVLTSSFESAISIQQVESRNIPM